MNDQFNNYNSQFNNQPPVNNGENPMQLPKRKFFTANIVDEPNIDEVGGNTSARVISWNNRNMTNNNQDTFTNQNINTGATSPGFGMSGQNDNFVVQQNTMEMPALNQNNGGWMQPQALEQPMTPQVMEMPQQVQTNSMGMALAEPVTEKQEPEEKNDSIEMLSEINGDVYVDNEPEVLDFDAKEENKNDNSSNYIKEKYLEEQKFQQDQLSQGNFASLMGNGGGSTFAPGMNKKEAMPEQPVQGVQQPMPQQPVAQPAPQPQPSEEGKTMLNAMPKPDLGIVSTPVPVQPAPGIGMASTPIFQAATEAADAPVQNQVNPQIQNQKVESWMTNQPLSGENFQPDKDIDVNNYSGVAEEKKVEIFNKKDKKNKKKETEPVPEEVTKKDEGKIRVDNMASAIVGSKYLQFVMSPFNFAAFFFGPTYMAYRRMPLAAIIVYLIQIAVVFFLPTLAPDEYYIFAQLGATLGFALLIALCVNRMILANAKFKAKSIVKKYGEDGPKDQAMIMAQRMGKPSIIMALLFLVLSGVVTGLLLTTVLKDTKLANIYNIYMDAYQNGEKVEYNGVIIHSDYDVSNIVSLEVPEGFTKIENMKYSYITESSAVNNDCSFEIYAVDKFTNAEKFINEMAKFKKDSDKVTNKEINGIEWTNYYTEDSMYKIFYRGFTYKNRAIIFEYRSGKKASDGICDQLYVKVMDGISIKES